MSKNINEVYDATMDAVNDTLSRFKAFYATHSVKDNPNDSVAFYFRKYEQEVIKGWQEIEMSRHKFNYNAHMAEHTDVSDRQWPRIRREPRLIVSACRKGKIAHSGDFSVFSCIYQKKV